MKYNTVMYKVNNRTKLFIRFLREKRVKYIFAEETLQNAYRKKYECKEFGKLLYCGTNGNLLNYFDKFFSRGIYDVIGRSFIWDYTKKGYDFWRKMNDMWFDYYFKKA